MNRILPLLLAGCLLPLTWASAQTTTLATLSVTNSAGITNGNYIIVAGQTWLVTNSTVSLRYIALGTNAAKATTNIYTKLRAGLSSRYMVSYGSTTNLKIQTYVGDTITASISTNWGTLTFATNTAGNASVGSSNVVASRITLAGVGITDWSDLGSVGNATNVHVSSSDLVTVQTNGLASWVVGVSTNAVRSAVTGGLTNLQVTTQFRLHNTAHSGDVTFTVPSVGSLQLEDLNNGNSIATLSTNGITSLKFIGQHIGDGGGLTNMSALTNSDTRAVTLMDTLTLGKQLTAGPAAVNAGTYSGIYGGLSNRITAGVYSFIAGGLSNTLSDFVGSFILGGSHNTAKGLPINVSILNGSYNLMDGPDYSLIGGGWSNTVMNGYFTTILNGQNNYIGLSAPSPNIGHATILGGISNNLTAPGTWALGSYLTNSTTNTIDIGFSDATKTTVSATGVRFRSPVTGTLGTFGTNYTDRVEATNSSALTLVGGGVSLSLNSGAAQIQSGHSFSGSGALLTDIPGSGITAGSISNAQIAASTINSNRFDAATLAKLYEAGGGTTYSNLTESGYTTTVRSNLVVNAGSGNTLVVANGNVGIGTNDPGTALDVVGVVKSTGGFQIGANAINSWDDVTNYFTQTGGGGTTYTNFATGTPGQIIGSGISTNMASLTIVSPRLNNPTNSGVVTFPDYSGGLLSQMYLLPGTGGLMQTIQQPGSKQAMRANTAANDMEWFTPASSSDQLFGGTIYFTNSITTNATIQTATIATNNTTRMVVTNLSHGILSNILVSLDSTGQFTNATIGSGLAFSGNVLSATGGSGTGSSNAVDSGYSYNVRSNLNVGGITTFSNTVNLAGTGLSQLAIGAAPSGGTNNFEVTGPDGTKTFQVGTNGNLIAQHTTISNLTLRGGITLKNGVSLGASGNGVNTDGYLLTSSTSFGYWGNTTDNSISTLGGNGPTEFTARGGLRVTTNLVVTGTSTATNSYASYASNLLASTSITVTASPFLWTNTLTKNVHVYVDGSAVTGTVGKNGQTIFSSMGNSTVPLQPGEYTTITYTVGTPTARFDPW